MDGVHHPGGVALGLAKEAAVEFPALGAQFSTLIIAVVVLNEMVGPLFFKWAINHLQEARTRPKRRNLMACAM